MALRTLGHRALIIAGISFMALGCSKPDTISKAEVGQQYNVYGDTILPIDTEEPAAILTALKENGTANMTIAGEVTSVCQMKGCWMRMALPNGEQMHITFADYSYFVPKDITGKKVIMAGQATLDTMAVEDLQHYAEDEGASEEEIAKITQPKITYVFDATGVLIPKTQAGS